MEKQFVTYEIALKLKELGFDEDCLARFYMGEFQLEFSPENYPYKEVNSFHAPLWQQAIDWFDETHGIVISYNNYRSGFYWAEISNKKGEILTPLALKYYSKETAREQAILKAIQIVKERKLADESKNT